MGKSKHRMPWERGSKDDDADSKLPVVVTNTQGGKPVTADQQVAEPPVKIDPSIIKAVTDYRIAIDEQCLEGLTKPTTWIMTGKGIVPVRRLPLGLFIGGPSGQGVPGLIEIPPQVRLAIPKLPFMELRKVVSFFRSINNARHAEAMVQYFWDKTANNGQGGYLAHAPAQDISGGGVRHASEFDKDGALLHVLDIHSHNTMSAFWSGTDDNDEKRFEGRLYGVIGNIDKAIPQMKWRTRVGGAFLDLDITHVIDFPTDGDIVIEKRFSMGELIKAALFNQKENTKFYFEATPFEDVDFPAEWTEATKGLLEAGKAAGDGSWGYGKHGQAGVLYDGGKDKDKGKAATYNEVSGQRFTLPAPLSREEREYLTSQGLVEVREGQWCPNPFGAASHPLAPKGVGHFSSTRTTGMGGMGGGNAGGGPTNPQRQGLEFRKCSHGQWLDKPCAACEAASQARRRAIGGSFQPRVSFVYDRVRGVLYVKDSTGMLYRSNLDVVEVCKQYPNTELEWVEGVDPKMIAAANFNITGLKH